MPQQNSVYEYSLLLSETELPNKSVNESSSENRLKLPVKPILAVSDDYGLELKLNPEYGAKLGQPAVSSTWQAGGNVLLKLDYQNYNFYTLPFL